MQHDTRPVRAAQQAIRLERLNHVARVCFNDVGLTQKANPLLRHGFALGRALCPQQDSNLCLCLRRATLYPLSYGGA